MTTSNHLYAGAAIAMAVPRPLLALPLAVLSHFVLDALPHYGHPGAKGYLDVIKHRLTLLMESVNIIGVPLLVYLLMGQPWWVWMAAAAALLPDAVWVFRYVWYERYGSLPVGNLLTRFHHHIQWERWWGIMIEIPALLFLVWLVMALR